MDLTNYASGHVVSGLAHGVRSSGAGLGLKTMDLGLSECILFVANASPPPTLSKCRKRITEGLLTGTP